MNRLVAAAPALTLAVLLGPVIAGLAGTLAPAFGYLPALGGDSVTLDPVRRLIAAPGFAQMILLTVIASLGGAVAALAMTVTFAAAAQGTRPFRILTRLISPLLAVPHAAAAIGFAFLIAPSGWIARLLSPWATGWERPPDLLIVNDPMGLTLTAFLAVKEFPFLFLMLLSALGQADADRTLAVTRTLGYGRVTGWLKAVWPRVWPQMRLPFYAVIAYGASAVDVAMVLGPTTPPPLAAQVVRWSNDPDLAQRFLAAAASLALLLLVIAELGLVRLVEAACSPLYRRWCTSGRRHPVDRGATGVIVLVAGLSALLIGGALAVLGLWSVAGQWRFPDAVPGSWRMTTWMTATDTLATPVANTLVIGLAAVAVALVLTVGCLEREDTAGRPGARNRALLLLYAPLLVPQVSFLFGLQVLSLAAGFDPTPAAVTMAHLVYVLPYVFLSLSDPWRARDRRYATTAQALGASQARILFAVKLPLMTRPLLAAAAVGFAVSVGQYLPTLLIGAGRVPTIATEAIAIASGSDRRLAGAAGLVQTLLPALAFLAVTLIPAIVFRNRRGLQVT